MSGTVTVPFNEVIIRLKKQGFSYREIARHLGVSHTTVRRWVYGVHKPKDLLNVLRRLTDLIDDDRLNLVDDYYSPTHNGPPNNYFSIRPGDSRLIERFKRSVKLIADFLDIQNSKLLDYVAEVGVKYLRENGDKKLYGVRLRSFTLACFRVVMYRLHYVYPDWISRFNFLSEVNLIDTSLYRRFFLELSGKYLA